MLKCVGWLGIDDLSDEDTVPATSNTEIGCRFPNGVPRSPLARPALRFGTGSGQRRKAISVRNRVLPPARRFVRTASATCLLRKVSSGRKSAVAGGTTCVLSRKWELPAAETVLRDAIALPGWRKGLGDWRVSSRAAIERFDLAGRREASVARTRPPAGRHL